MNTARVWRWGALVAGALLCGAMSTSPPALGQVPAQPTPPPPGGQPPAFPFGQNGGVWSFGGGGGGGQFRAFALQSESAQLAQQYVKAEGEEEKRGIRKKLAESLSKQFDAHLEHQQKELE